MFMTLLCLSYELQNFTGCLLLLPPAATLFTEQTEWLQEEQRRISVHRYDIWRTHLWDLLAPNVIIIINNSYFTCSMILIYWLDEKVTPGHFSIETTETQWGVSCLFSIKPWPCSGAAAFLLIPLHFPVKVTLRWDSLFRSHGAATSGRTSQYLWGSNQTWLVFSLNSAAFWLRGGRWFRTEREKITSLQSLT